MSFIQYFDAESVKELKQVQWPQNSIGSRIELFNDETFFNNEFPKCVIFFVGKPKHVNAFELLRNYLYGLYVHHQAFSMADLGDFDISQEEQLPEIIKSLMSYGCIPIIISPYKYVAYYNYVAYCLAETNINISSVDAYLNFGSVAENLSNNNFLAKIIEHAPNYLFNLTNLGYQIYLNDPDEISSYDKLNFDTYRLGQIRNSLVEIEPVMRNTDMLCFDLSSIRTSDAHHNDIPMPNGFYAEEACRIIRYAGISNRLSSAGVYGLEAGRESKDLIMLSAQLIWHLVDGVFNRTSDGHLNNAYLYTVYNVDLAEQDMQITFYKHNFNEKWWMSLPANNGKKRSQVIACSYSDYEKAIKGELPNSWWTTFRKLV
jgi:formiminoglutamase